MSERAPLPRAPKFGEWLRGIYASEDNPIRDGMYVETICVPKGQMNAGKWYRLTDGKGMFWKFETNAVVFRDEADAIGAVPEIPSRSTMNTAPGGGRGRPEEEDKDE